VRACVRGWLCVCQCIAVCVSVCVFVDLFKPPLCVFIGEGIITFAGKTSRQTAWFKLHLQIILRIKMKIKCTRQDLLPQEITDNVR